MDDSSNVFSMSYFNQNDSAKLNLNNFNSFFQKRVLLLILATLISSTLLSQEFGIKWKGFVKTDYFFDSRQTVTAREGHFLLYPANEMLDLSGNDINANTNLNMLSIQTRLTGIITGPEILGAKSSGVIEGAFFGHSNGDINGFRLRHAYTKLNWEKTEVLFGQTWHPMFITECFPGVISFNTGVPFVVFSRNPQVRLTYSFGKIKIIGALMSQRDFASFGGSTSLRNSAMPDMQLQVKYKTTNFLLGAGAGYKELLPRLVTDLNYEAENRVKALSYMAYTRYDSDRFIIKATGIFGANMFDGLMLGGYAQKDPSNLNDYLNFDYREYTAINTLSLWSEIMTKGDSKMQYGIFGGYTKDLGSKDQIYDFQSTTSYYSRGSNIAYVYRISPRAVYSAGKMKFAVETEYTVAGYGDTRNSYGIVQDQSAEFPNAEINDVSNFRLLFSVIYSF